MGAENDVEFPGGWQEARYSSPGLHAQEALGMGIRPRHSAGDACVGHQVTCSFLVSKAGGSVYSFHLSVLAGYRSTDRKQLRNDSLPSYAPPTVLLQNVCHFIHILIRFKKKILDCTILKVILSKLVSTTEMVKFSSALIEIQ